MSHADFQFTWEGRATNPAVPLMLPIHFRLFPTDTVMGVLAYAPFVADALDVASLEKTQNLQGTFALFPKEHLLDVAEIYAEYFLQPTRGSTPLRQHRGSVPGCARRLREPVFHPPPRRPPPRRPAQGPSRRHAPTHGRERGGLGDPRAVSGEDPVRKAVGLRRRRRPAALAGLAAILLAAACDANVILLQPEQARHRRRRHAGDPGHGHRLGAEAGLESRHGCARRHGTRAARPYPGHPVVCH